MEGKVRGTYPMPKDSKAAVGVRNRATGKAPEGADRQTNRLYVHYIGMLVYSGEFS